MALEVLKSLTIKQLNASKKAKLEVYVMYNKVILIGRPTRDPDFRATKNGNMVANFTLAVDRDYRDENGNKQTDFPRITAWGKTAELIEKYVKKGSKIAVEGSIMTGSYEKDGQKVYTTDVNASRVVFLDSKGKESDEHKQPFPDDFEPQQLDDSDIPF